MTDDQLQTVDLLVNRSAVTAVSMSRASVTTELSRLLEDGRFERRGVARATRYCLHPGA